MQMDFSDTDHYTAEMEKTRGLRLQSVQNAQSIEKAVEGLHNRPGLPEDSSGMLQQFSRVQRINPDDLVDSDAHVLSLSVRSPPTTTPKNPHKKHRKRDDHSDSELDDRSRRVMAGDEAFRALKNQDYDGLVKYIQNPPLT